jgi:hypothetical protein
MKSTNVSLEEWKALYQAAREFEEIKPWEWMVETDIFGVQDPLTGEIGYCCVMGELGEVLAMAVYLGTEGLQGYIDIIDGLVEPDGPDSMFSQDCLIVSFEDKDSLDKEELAFIRKLGLRFSGKKAWPLFNRYEPGYVPSPVNIKDVRFFKTVLQQAKEVCLRLKEDDVLCPPEEKVYLVRVLDSAKNTWEDAWMAPAPLKKTESHARIDELHIQKIKKIAKPSPAVWEVDFFYAPTPIEAERPYYPYAIMIADSVSGFIQDMQLSEREEYSAAFPASFLSCLENKALLPSEIQVRKDETAALLQPLLLKLGIKMRKVGKLPAIDRARRDMLMQLQGGAGMGLSPGPYCGDEIMEEYLEEAGSEMSLFGLYGLFYGCHAAPRPVMPAEFLPLIFGEEGAQFETDEDAQAMLDNVLSLWDLLGQCDAETEGLALPEIDYEADAEGATYRIYDALALVGYFLEGLEIGGITFEELERKRKNETEALLRTTDLLNAYAGLIEKEKGPDNKKLEEAIEAIGRAELIIAGSLAGITAGLKGERLHSAGQSRQGPKAKLTGFQEIKVGRNDPCPCGSGKKYKKCCGLVH